MTLVANTTPNTITVLGWRIRPSREVGDVDVDIPEEKLASLVGNGFIVIKKPAEPPAAEKPAPVIDLATCPKASELVGAASVDGVSSGDVERLVASGQDLLGALNNRIRIANAELLDPVTPEDRVAELKREIDELQTSMHRTTAALAHLQRRLNEVREAERAAARQAEYASALAERDALIKDLGHCPVLFGKVADLLQRLKANRDCITALAAGGWRPGEAPIIDAEPLARGFTEKSGFPFGQVSLLHKTSIPHFAAEKASPTGTQFGPAVGSYY